MNYNWQPDTLRLAREALKVAIIKAALDERQDDKRNMEAALADLNTAVVGSLPDKPGTIPCHMTLEELTDIQGAVLHDMERFGGSSVSAIRIQARLLRLHERVTATIKMNPPR